MNFTRILLICICICICIAFSGIASAKSLRIGITRVLDSRDPAKVTSFAGTLYMRLFTRTLTTANSDGSITGDLAEKWSISDDGRIYTITLKDGLHFSDGSPMTSRDVINSISRHFWGSQSSYGSQLLREIISGAANVREGTSIAGLKPLSDQHFQIKLAKSYPPILKVLSYSLWGIVKKSKHGRLVSLGDYDIKTISKDRIFLEKVGTGQTSCGFDSFDFSLIGKGEGLSQGLLTKKLDVVIGKIPKSIPSHMVTSGLGGQGYIHLFYNNVKTIFTDAELRADVNKSLSPIFDRITPAGLISTRASKFLPPGALTISYSQTRDTISELATAEFRKKWHTKTRGKKLRLRLPPFFSKNDVALLSRQIEAMGFTPDVTTHSFPELTQMFIKRDFDLAAQGYVGTIPDPDGYINPLKRADFFPDRKSLDADLFDGLNKYRYTNTSLERLRGYEAVFNSFEKKAYFLPLFFARYPITLSKNIIADTLFQYDPDLCQIIKASPQEQATK